jgi:hypothetical protein
VGDVLTFLTLLGCGTLVTAPILALVHELGHANAARHAGQRALVLAGRQPPLLTVRFERVEVRVSPIPPPFRRGSPHTPTFRQPGLCVFELKGLTVGDYRRIVRAGPLAEAFAGACFCVLALLVKPGTIPFFVLGGAALDGVVAAMWNLWPYRRRNSPADGAKLRLLQGLPADRLVLDTRR